MRQRVCSLIRQGLPVLADEGLLSASGASVPSAVSGYQPGCLFQDTTNGKLYVNEGTLASCTFAVIEALTAAQEALLGATAGVVTASKAVIVDSNKDVGDYRNLDCVNLDAGSSGAAGSVDVFPATASKGKLAVSCTDQAGDTTVSLVVAEMAAARVINLPDPGKTSYLMQSTAQITCAEADVLDAAVAGTVVASKAVVADASKDVGDFRNLDCQNLDAGASGSAGSVDVFPGTASKGKLAVTCTDQATDATVSLVVDEMAAARVVHLPDPGAASYLMQSTAQITLAEADVLDAATAGTQVASKAVIANADVNIGVVKATALHIGATGSETQVIATAAELNYCDVTTVGSAQASKAVVADANITARFGDWVGSAATSGGVGFTTDLNKYSDGQLDVLGVYGASASDLGSGYSAKCGRFRHIVNSTACAHETYGLVGQVVVKDTTLTHLHAGLMGTFEGHTSGVVSTPGYRYGTACVSARLGGGGAITATTPISGFAAIFNGAALASGSSVAYAVTNTAAGEWDYVIGVTHAGSGVDNGVEIVDGEAGDTGASGKVGYDALMKVDIGGTTYYIALFDAGSVTGEA